jgi:hypothetical protein
MESRLKNLHTDLLRTSLTYKNDNLFFLSQVYIAESHFGVYNLINAINLIKRFSLDSVLKFLMLKFSSPWSNWKRIPKEIDYSFVNEINNKAVIETLNFVKNEFKGEPSITIYSDMRIGKINDENVNIFELLTFRVVMTSIVDSFAMLLTIYRYRKELNLISNKYGVSSVYLLFNFFDSILLVNLVDRLFSIIQIKKLILMSDVHKLSRILVSRAKSSSCKAFVIQHGATIGEEGYLPITANKILVWGESSKKWFIDQGQQSDKIVVTGSPRMDLTHYLPIKQNSNSVQIRKVLIILSDILVEKKYLETIKQAFVNLAIDELEIVIKLHPGGSVDYSSIPENIFKGTGLHYKILRFESIKALLEATDIVFVTNSTVGMEAIIFNKPLFQYKGDELLNYKMSYEDYNCTHIFKKVQDICDVLETPNEVFTKLKNYSEFVSYYFHQLDGNSSLRVKEFIVSN